MLSYTPFNSLIIWFSVKYRIISSNIGASTEHKDFDQYMILIYSTKICVGIVAGENNWFIALLAYGSSNWMVCRLNKISKTFRCPIIAEIFTSFLM